jgi:hypothetical protein
MAKDKGNDKDKAAFTLGDLAKYAATLDTSKSDEPKDVAIGRLENSKALWLDPNYRIPNRKKGGTDNATKPQSAVTAQTNGQYAVAIVYGKDRINLKSLGISGDVVIVPREMVEGVHDTFIQAIKDDKLKDELQAAADAAQSRLEDARAAKIAKTICEKEASKHWNEWKKKENQKDYWKNNKASIMKDLGVTTDQLLNASIDQLLARKK